MIPDGQQKYTDLIDIVIQAAQTQVDVEQKDGSITKETIIDPEVIWWKTGSVNSPTFARFALELKELERLALTAFENMMPDRARAFAHNIIDLGTSYRRSIDAKSSESRLNKENSQSTLIDKINRNKIERVYTSKGEQTKKSLADIFMGRDKENDIEED